MRNVNIYQPLINIQNLLVTFYVVSAFSWFLMPFGHNCTLNISNARNGMAPEQLCCNNVIIQSSKCSTFMLIHVLVIVPKDIDVFQFTGSLSFLCCTGNTYRFNSSLTIGLSIGLQNLNVHGRVNPTENLPGFVSTVFVTCMDGAGLPVGPV